jgi:hypothetical protein
MDGVTGRLVDRRDAVGGAVQHDRRHRDRRLGGETLLDRLQCRVARGQAVAVAVRLDRHRDEVGVVEARRGRVKGRIVELPVRRPQMPQQPGDVAAVLLEPGMSALGVEIPLIPEAMFLRRRGRMAGHGDVLDVVAADRNQPAHPLRP